MTNNQQQTTKRGQTAALYWQRQHAVKPIVDKIAFNDRIEIVNYMVDDRENFNDNYNPYATIIVF